MQDQWDYVHSAPSEAFHSIYQHINGHGYVNEFLAEPMQVATLRNNIAGISLHKASMGNNAMDESDVIVCVRLLFQEFVTHLLLITAILPEQLQQQDLFVVMVHSHDW